MMFFSAWEFFMAISWRFFGGPWDINVSSMMGVLLKMVHVVHRFPSIKW